jgi:RHS repeat-associated protein
LAGAAHLGSVRGVVDNSVGVLESRNYDPYGELFDATGSSQTSYGFTGEPTDDNNLVHLRARPYNPALGLFPTLDPFEGFEDDPMSINGYSYVGGDPINRIDPSGQSWEEDFWTGIGKTIANALPWEWINPDAADKKLRPMPCNPVNLNGMPGFAPSCDPRKLAEQMNNLCSPRSLQEQRHQAFVDLFTPVVQQITRASYWARVALGYEALPTGVSQWQAAGNAVLGLYDVLSGGGISNIQSGDPTRVVAGILQLIGLAQTVGGGYEIYQSLFQDSTFNAISNSLFSSDLVLEEPIFNSEGRLIGFTEKTIPARQVYRVARYITPDEAVELYRLYGQDNVEIALAKDLSMRHIWHTHP